MNKLKYITSIGLSIFIIFFMAQQVHGQEGSTEKMRINEIPMRNFITRTTARDVDLFATNQSSAYFDTLTNTFFIEIFGPEYSVARADSEKNILQTLDITRNESCYLNYIFKATNEDYTANDLSEFSDSPTFCSSPAQQDLNDDSVVNGVDFGQCIADYETSDEAESAFDRLTKREVVKLSTGQSLESLYELDLPCDFNVNRHIDALDLSKVIYAIELSAESQK